MNCKAETAEQREKRLEYHRNYMRAFRSRHPEKQREANARYACKHKDKLRDLRKQRYLAKREGIIRRACEYSKQNRERINARNRRNRLLDPEKYKDKNRHAYLKSRDKDKQRRAARRTELAAYMRKKRNTDPQFAIADRLRRRINQALRTANASKCGGMVEASGCDLSSLVRHIESQFADGMSWLNRNEWHIDHIVPLSAFDLADHDQQKVAFHFTNLRPLWATDNLRKQASVPQGQLQLFWDQSHVERIAKTVKRRKTA
jgi:hypothetical protein